MTIVEHSRRDGRDILAVRTGMTARAFAQARMPQELAVPGIVIDPSGTIEDWMPEGTYCEGQGEGGPIAVYGPAFPGTTLLAAFSDSREAAWKILYQGILLIHKASIAKSISSERLAAIAGAGPEAILVADDGRVLVLPSTLYAKAIGNQGERAAFENRFRWIHPDYLTITPSRAFAFLAGTAAYRIAAGFSPFEARIEMGSNAPSESFIAAEDTARNIRRSIFEPLALALWNVRPAAAACIDTLVSTQYATSSDTLLAFGPDFSAIIDSQKGEEAESDEHREARETARKRRTALIKRERFIRAHRRTFGIGAIIAATVAILAGVYVSDMRAKPSTLGLGPDEVVAGYYAAIANLDQEIPQGYSAPRVKSEYGELVTNLYVTSKIRQSYEMNAGILSPAQLFARGAPGNGTIFGMTGLDIRRTTLNDREAEYRVSLFLWVPMSGNAPTTTLDGPTQAQITIYRYDDTVRLEYLKDRWKIAEFLPEGRTVVEEDSSAILGMIAEGSAADRPWAPSAEEIEKARAGLPPKAE